MNYRNRYLLVILVVGLLSLKVNSQNVRTTIKVQAMEMAKALIKNDFASFSKYMHPKVIELAGGKAEMKNKMDSADFMMKQFSVAFKKITIGIPSEVITYKKQLQCTIPQSTTMETPMGEINAETTLIAISLNNGKNWYYIDTNIYKADKLKSALPDLSPKLVIPPQKEPKLNK